MTQRTTGGLQPQPEPLLSQRPPVVPCPPAAQQKAWLWLHSCSPECCWSPVARPPHWLTPSSCAPGPRRKKPPWKVVETAWPRVVLGRLGSSPGGTACPNGFLLLCKVLRQKGGVGSRGGLPTVGRCCPCQGGWQGRLAHPAPAARCCCAHSQAPSLALGCSSQAAPESCSTQPPPAWGCPAPIWVLGTPGSPANISPAAACPAAGFVSGRIQQTIVQMQWEVMSAPHICVDGCIMS